MKETNYQDFLRVFKDCETMPKNKEDLMIKLFTFYNAGVRNESERIANKLRQLID
jgi:hypothetical protein